MISKTPIAATAASSSCPTPSLFRRPAALLPARAAPPPPTSWLPPSPPAAAAGRIHMCQVALAADVSSSSLEAVAEEAAAAAKIGARIRVKASVKIYHVTKAPELDLCGMEGVIKQYVRVWKGKRISANLPFKVEFILPSGVQERPVKVVAHLREEEFEYLPSSD